MEELEKELKKPEKIWKSDIDYELKIFDVYEPEYTSDEDIKTQKIQIKISKIKKIPSSSNLKT